MAALALAATLSSGEAAPAAVEPKAGRVPVAYGQLPLSFVANVGQTDPRAAFVAHGPGYTLFLASGETVFVAQPTAPAGPGLAAQLRGGQRRETDAGRAHGTSGAVVSMRLLGANAAAILTGEERTSSVNYLMGSDPAQWRTGVPAYARVRSLGVYAGVDLVFYGSGRQFEYDFVLAPGTDPQSIRLGFEGLTGTTESPALRIDAQGDLVLRTAGGELRLRKPAAYQDIQGTRHERPAHYTVRGRAPIARDSLPEVGIAVTAYDPTHPLIIDPILDYASYLGGAGSDAGLAVAVDATGHAYVAGYTESADFPGSSGVPPSGAAAAASSRKAFVAKLNPAGSALVYATYLGGDGHDAATAIAVDAQGNAYITGSTDSANFPTVGALHADRGGTDAFVTKLDAAGSSLLYSTYLGGSDRDVGLGIAVDGAGRIYVTGATESGDSFPQRARFQVPPGGGDGFVAKLDPMVSGDPSLVYATVFGGSGRDEGHAIAVDAQGCAHVTGVTESTDFRLQTRFQGDQPGPDAFVMKVSADGKSKLYSTYLGGSGTDVGLGIALDVAGRIYVTGHTDSPDFPTKWPYQATRQGSTGPDAFVSVLNPEVGNAASLLYSTYLGGTAADAGHAIALGPAGHVYVAGSTESVDFPAVNAVQAYGGGRDAFVARLALAGTAIQLIYATPLGGAQDDEAVGLAVDGEGDAYVTGLTQSANFPTVTALATTLGGGQDAFVARIGEIPPSADLTVSALSATISGSSVTVSETTSNTGTLAVPATITRYYLSFDAVLDGADMPIGSRNVPPLAGGASSSVSTVISLPAGTPPGRYVVLAAADAAGAVAESDETNNVASAPGLLGIGGDLVVFIDVPAASSTPPAGATISILDITKNEASTPAAASTTKLYLVQGTAIGAPAVLLGSRAVPPLAPGEISSGSTTFTLPAGLTGAQFIFARADADDAIGESDEANNFSQPRSIAIGADLIVWIDVPGIVTGLPPGATFTVRDFTRSDNSAPAGPSRTNFYLVNQADGSEILLGGRAVPALPPSTTNEGFTDLVLPAGAVGTYRIVARADADNAVVEISESNNASPPSSPVTMGPDLVVFLDLPAESSALPVGATFMIEDATRNLGGAPIGPTITGFWLSADTQLDAGDVFLGGRLVPALAAGERHPATGSVATSLTLPPGIAGKYHVIAVADAGQHASEHNEGNNQTATSIPISIGPDLAVTAISGIPSTASAGATIFVSDVTRNHGAGVAPGTTTRIYLSTDPVVDPGDILLGSRNIPSLASPFTSPSSQTQSEGTTPVVIPPDTPGGFYYIIVGGDGGGLVAESDESNNARSQFLEIRPNLKGVKPRTHVLADVHGNGKADIVLRNAISGRLTTWSMDGATIAASGPTRDIGWDWGIQGFGDFNGDGKTDILWRNASGLVDVWIMDGPIVAASGVNPYQSDWGWTIQGVGDFNGDGKADILWRNVSGLVDIWFMDGPFIAAAGVHQYMTDWGWTIQAVADFDGDGKADILWRNVSGLVDIWFMDGPFIRRSGTQYLLGLEWTIQGVGDLNGDGKADMLWQHSTGLLHVWFMNGPLVGGQQTIQVNPNVAPPAWLIQ